MSLKTWWQDRKLTAAQKCIKRGHKVVTRHRSGLLGSKSWSYVAYSVKQERVVCTRCKAGQKEWRTTQEKGIHSLSLPAELADKFTKDGELWD